MAEYLLTIKVPIDAMDDIDARKTAKAFMSCLKIPDKVMLPDGTNIKVQRVYKDKQPRLIEEFLPR